MARYTRIPITVEAEQLTKDMVVITSKGEVSAPRGSWRLVWPDGRVLVMRDDQFRENYQIADEPGYDAWDNDDSYFIGMSYGD